MPDIPYSTALIVGAGPGISASVTRRLRAANLPVVIAARNVELIELRVSTNIGRYLQAKLYDLRD